MLYRDVLRYLGQPMPDLTGIFRTGAAQPFVQPEPDGLEQVQKQIDTLQMYPTNYKPYIGPYNEGGGDEGFAGNLDTTNNAGITSLGDIPGAISNAFGSISKKVNPASLLGFIHPLAGIL